MILLPRRRGKTGTDFLDDKSLYNLRRDHERHAVGQAFVLTRVLLPSYREYREPNVAVDPSCYPTVLDAVRGPRGV